MKYDIVPTQILSFCGKYCCGKNIAVANIVQEICYASRVPIQTQLTLLCAQIVLAFRWGNLIWKIQYHVNIKISFHENIFCSQGAFPCAPGDKVCALDYKTSGCSGRKKRSAHEAAFPGNAHPEHSHHGAGGAHPGAGAHPNAFAHHGAPQPNLAHPQAAAFPGNAF